MNSVCELPNKDKGIDEFCHLTPEGPIAGVGQGAPSPFLTSKEVWGGL